MRCTWPLHGNFRSHKAQFFVELCDTIPARTQHPRHLLVVAHRGLDERPSHSLATMMLRYDQHGQISIGYPIAQRSKKTNDGPIFNCDQRDLGLRQQVAKILRVPDAMLPATGNEKSPCGFHFQGQDAADLHDA